MLFSFYSQWNTLTCQWRKLLLTLIILSSSHRRFFEKSHLFHIQMQRCSVNKAFLKISQNLQENTCARVSFLIKLLTKACNFILKIRSGTSVFLWILWNFQECLVYSTPLHLYITKDDFDDVQIIHWLEIFFKKYRNHFFIFLLLNFQTSKFKLFLICSYFLLISASLFL